jgi:hypothetical protein
MVSMLASSAVDGGFIAGVMVSMLASSAVDRGVERWLGPTKDYEIGICWFSAKIKRKKKNWLSQNQDNVSEWDDMSICRLLSEWDDMSICRLLSEWDDMSICWLLFQLTGTMQIQLSVLV